ncbi:hypothetical protein B0H10DRAFT_2083660, partial [Mycena sp. CBHHK59/15]
MGSADCGSGGWVGRVPGCARRSAGIGPASSRRGGMDPGGDVGIEGLNGDAGDGEGAVVTRGRADARTGSVVGMRVEACDG